mgnify:CR=1 FL=1
MEPDLNMTTLLLKRIMYLTEDILRLNNEVKELKEKMNEKKKCRIVPMKIG